MPDLPDGAAELYRLPLEEFTKARDALAKERKKSGDAEGAAAVKALKRPANAAWALNQVAAQEPDVIRNVLDAGARLRAATEAGDRAGLVEATKAERAAREAVAKQTGVSGAVLQQVLDTLHAALVDDDVAERLREGTLDKAYTSSGFDFGGAMPVSRPKPPAAKKKAASAKGSTEEDRAAAKARAEDEARAKAEAEARAKRKAEAERARRRAEKLDHEADLAEARAAEARQLADEARAEADELAELV